MKRNNSWIKAFLSEAGPGRTIEYAPRRRVFLEQGERSNAVFYILAGAVALTVLSGGKERIIDLLGPGSFAGKDCLAAARPCSTVSSKALTNCTVLRIERKEMLRVIHAEPTFAVMFLDHMLGRINRYQNVIADHLFDSAKTRLARILLLLANFSVGSETEAVVPNIGQDELAEVVGTTRSRTSSFLNQFRIMGLISYKSHGPLTVRTAKLSKWLTDNHPTVKERAKAAAV